MNVYHPRLSAGLWLAGMVLIGGFGIRALNQDWLETGFLALLPKIEQNPDIAAALEWHNRLINSKVIWLAGAANSFDAVAEARLVERRVRSSGLFSRIAFQVPQDQAIHQYRQLLRYRHQLLDNQTRHLLENSPRTLLEQNLEWLYSPVGQLQAATIERDPLLLFNRYFSSQTPVKFTLDQGVAIVHDGNTYWALLMADLKDPQLPLDALEKLLQAVRTATAEIREAGGELLVSGMPLFTAYGAESAKQEISTVGAGSFLGIFFLFLITFRSIRPLLLSTVAIAAGLAVALIVSILVFGKIHIITLVFGASLIGVVDDYAQHYLCDSFGERDWNPRKGLVSIFPALFLGLISNMLSYAGLGFSPFPGLQEVALFSAVGLFAAWLTVVLLFPLLLSGFKFNREPGLLKLAAVWERNWPVWAKKHRPALSVLMLIVLAGGVWKLSPQDDVRLLQSAPKELVQPGEKIKQLLQVSDSQFFLVSGKNLHDWHQNEQQLLGKLDELIQRKALKSYEGLSRYWPDPEMQRDNYRLLKQTLYDSGWVERYMTDLGFGKDAIETELGQFGEAEQKTLSLPEWLASADEGKQRLWMGCGPAKCSSIAALTGVKEIKALAALRDLPGVEWVDPVEQLSSLFGRYRIRASLLLFAAFTVVLLGLCMKVGWRGAFTVMSIPTVSVLMALAMSGWFNQLFSLFNLFALLLVLGIGVDYAVFFFLAGDKRVSTSLAVTLSGLTTLLSFGLLAVSSTEIVHAFGFTVAAGIITAMLTAPLIGKQKGL